jgi:NAD-dependent DNA ligase
MLENIKEYLDDKYYNESNETNDSHSEFTDEQYDILKDVIVKKNPKYKETVGAKIREDNNRIKLPCWLGSLDKIKNSDENKLKNWIVKNKTKEYNIECKLDGISCLITFKNGNINLFTRGDGTIGSDISHLTKYIKNMPNFLTLKNDISVRGELIIKKDTFSKKYSTKFANSRNMISGLVNSKSLKEGVEDILFIAYELITESIDEKLQINPSEQLKILIKSGFDIVENKIINEISMDELTKELLYFKDKSEFEIDGIIIQSNLPYERNTKDNPKYAFAFKITLIDNLIEAEVEQVEWNISKYQLLKPRIKIKPVNLNGVTITYTSGFNAKYILEKSIGKGSIIKITRSGDVIPFIVEVMKPSLNPDMPLIKYRWNENNVDIIAEEDDNNISDIKMISSFFSNMGIKNVSDSTVEKIYNKGYNSLFKILEATVEDFEKIDGFKKTLAEKVYNNIHNGLQNISKDVLLGSFCVFGEGLGIRKVKCLLDNFPEILVVDIPRNELIEKIIHIPGFSVKTAEKIANNIYKVKEFLKKVDKFVTYKELIEEKKDIIQLNNLKDISVLFSGFRNKDLEKQIILNNGVISTSVSKNLSVLVVKDKENNSSKIKKAKDLNIKILYESEFIEEYLK